MAGVCRIRVKGLGVVVSGSLEANEGVEYITDSDEDEVSRLGCVEFGLVKFEL